MEIISIEDSGYQNTFDLEVPVDHEYLLESGVRSHNTSQLLGNRPSVEPLHYNYYLRNNDNGRTVVANSYLEKDIVDMGYNPLDFYATLPENGSVQNSKLLSAEQKELYKTIWEIPQKRLFKLQQIMGTFIDQSSSNNVFIKDINYSKMTSLEFTGWVLGLKTSRYYLHMETSKAQSFSNTCESCSG